MPKLFAAYVGGRAPKCNTELHDVIFVVGDTIEQTYSQLTQLWFGSREDLHIDSWLELSVIDGHAVTLSKTPASTTQKLFFVNLGAYEAQQFTETHANAFMVGADVESVKQRAKSSLLKGMDKIHTDSLFEVDDCLAVESVQGWFVHLEPTDQADEWQPVNDYHVIPYSF